MKTSRERAEEKREEKLEQIRDAVASGKLVVREMTEEERLEVSGAAGAGVEATLQQVVRQLQQAARRSAPGCPTGRVQRSHARPRTARSAPEQSPHSTRC